VGGCFIKCLQKASILKQGKRFGLAGGSVVIFISEVVEVDFHAS
jgi:hypothetical protein